MMSCRLLPLRDSHLPLLAAWLDRPHVARWFHPADEWLTEVREHMGRPTWLQHFIAVDADVPFAFAQRYDIAGAPGGEWSAAPPGSFGMDLFIAEPTRLRRGLGRCLLRRLASDTFASTAATGLVADPVPENLAARAFFARCGFLPLPDTSLWWLPRGTDVASGTAQTRRTR